MDGVYLLTKIGRVLESQAFITDKIAVVDGLPAVHVAKTAPVGRAYPQITMDLDLGNSHPSFNTTEALVTINVWYNGPNDKQSDALMFLKPMNQFIVNLLNRAGKDSGTCLLNEIVKEENIGLRVSRFLKTFSKEYDYDDELKKFFSVIIFEVVMSENEDFTTVYGPGTKWP